MPKILTAPQLKLLSEIQHCTGMEDPEQAINFFMETARQQIRKDWHAFLFYRAVVNAGMPLTLDLPKTHFNELQVCRILGTDLMTWRMSLRALAETNDLAAQQVLHEYHKVFTDDVVLGSLVALMGHYRFPAGDLSSRQIQSTKPCLGLFLSVHLALSMNR